MTPESSAPPSVDPQILGKLFVQQYYNHLFESPSDVHKFYLEDSVLGRPGLDGEMVSVKSLKAINDQIMSFDHQYSKIHILSVDSQPSLNSGVVTLVAGVMIGKDGGSKKFTQTFFLVPHERSYFVRNDVFRYMSSDFVEPQDTIEVEERPEPTAEPANENVEAVQAKTRVTKPQEDAKPKAVNGNSNVPKAAEEKPQEDAPKRSFAAVIVQSAAQNGSPFNGKASPAKPKPVEKPRVAPKPKAPAPAPAPAPVPEHSSAETKTIEQPGQGSTIFVANLPMDATPEQLYETFKGFGAIRKGGIQVRSYTEKRNCFGFVAFESSEAIKSVFQAHKESPIIIGNRRASIEEKRGNTNQNGARNNGYNRNENGHRNDGHRQPRGNGFKGGRRVERQNGEAGDGKAYQKNGHGNAQTRN
uniref:Putative G3BP-like protein n=1 Tax=Noccaea caerulescens TaxID=107243 RepID=A0A1J3JX59_NOCCA